MAMLTAAGLVKLSTILSLWCVNLARNRRHIYFNYVFIAIIRYAFSGVIFDGSNMAASPSEWSDFLPHFYFCLGTLNFAAVFINYTCNYKSDY